MDAEIARQFPECAKYVDTVFESSARPAVTADAQYNRLKLEEPAAMVEYVVVHPSADQAAAMLDSMQEPAFASECVPAYVTTMPKQCCAELTNFFPAVLAIPGKEPPKLDVGADDIMVAASDGSWTDDQGVVHGPEGYVWAAIRVGRVVAMIEGLTNASDGSPVSDARSVRGDRQAHGRACCKRPARTNSPLTGHSSGGITPHSGLRCGRTDRSEESVATERSRHGIPGQGQRDSEPSDAQAKDKMDDVKDKRKVDDLLDDLGRILYRRRTDRGGPGDEAEIVALVDELRKLEADGAEVLPPPPVAPAAAAPTGDPLPPPTPA